MLFICYSRCTTCKKARKHLEDAGIDLTIRDIKEDQPTEQELTDWIARSGKAIKAFFNTSGQIYRQQGLKDKLPTLSDEEQIKLLASDGMLVKRPILVAGEQVLVGYRPQEYDALLS